MIDLSLTGVGISVKIIEFKLSEIENIKKILINNNFEIDDYLWSEIHLPFFDNKINEYSFSGIELESASLEGIENFNFKNIKKIPCQYPIYNNENLYWIEVALEFQTQEFSLDLDDEVDINDFGFNFISLNLKTEEYPTQIRLIKNIFYNKNKIEQTEDSVAIERRDLYIQYLNNKNEIINIISGNELI